MLSIWNRVMKMSENKLTKHIFNYDRLLCRNNWSADMKLLFSKLNMNDNYDSDSLCYMNIHQEQCLILNTAQWKTDVNSKPKLRIYMLFKDVFKLDEYDRCTKDTDHSLYHFD